VTGFAVKAAGNAGVAPTDLLTRTVASYERR
jgi:hypothetical protein